MHYAPIALEEESFLALHPLQTSFIVERMHDELEKLLADYDYKLPPELIAQAPASPRDAARILVFSRKTKAVKEDVFSSLGNFLPPDSLIVVNNTKVLPARLFGDRASGGRVGILVLQVGEGGIEVLADKKLKEGEIINLHGKGLFTVLRRKGEGYFLSASFDLRELSQLLEVEGHMPLPPYIKHSPLSEHEARREYQTVFATEGGAIAAPTAALHFTPHLVRSLESAGHEFATVTLHVGMGTFAPLREESLRSGRLHEEHFEIGDEAAEQIREAMRVGRPIIAVGTTVVRTLESAMQSGGIRSTTGTTDLFIRPGFSFKVVDGLITNFHVPRSSLLMLVAAFTGRDDMFALYSRAIQERFRFFSFGDAMLLL